MNNNIENNNFAYMTQETQSISELRRQLNEILRELINQEFINKETGLKDIAPLYKNATLKETHLDSKERPNVANVHRFTIDIEVNGKDTIAKITAFEKIKGDNRIYTIELQGLNPLPYSPSMQEAEVAKSLSQDGTLAHTSDPNIANFNGSVAQESLKNQHIKPKNKITKQKSKNNNCERNV